MPSTKKHLRNAKDHYDAAVTAAVQPETRSWAAVAAFYCAHQLVHAVLANETQLAEEMRHPESHGTSRDVLGTSVLVARLYRAIDLAYLSLFATGKAVRYEGRRVSEREIRDLLDSDLPTVRAWARDRLMTQGRNPDEDWP